jgi:hypothetical protein
VETTFGATRAHLCDLLERNLDEIAIEEGVVELRLSPFKILSLKLEA